MTPRPSTTVPSTGQISWGSTSRRSPTATSSSAISSKEVPAFRCATEGMRFASAFSTDEALLTA
jgi:hypothetical protein